MQAIILAGGKGTRLQPYTTIFPKPLVPLDNHPILEIVLKQLNANGFREVIISTGHFAELIEAYFGNGGKLGLNIRYVREDIPLGTAGALGLIDDMEENILVMNGDILTTLDYKKLFEFHMQKKAAATVSVHERQEKIEYGVIDMSNENTLETYTEKPVYHFLVSMGINILNRRCKNYIKKGEVLSMPELLLRMKNNGEKVLCYPSDDYWLDIGRVGDYQKAQDEFETNRARFLI